MAKKASKEKVVQKTLTGKKAKPSVRKTAKKTKAKASKKTAKKSKPKKSGAKNSKLLKNVPKEYYFFLVDGKQIKSLPELALEIENMADEIFYHHVNDARNDFANWIRDIIGEIELADKLMNINEKKDMQLQLLKHIVKSI